MYGRDEWAAIVAQFLRYSSLAGITPRFPRRRRVAALGGAAGSHMSRRVAQTVGVGIHNVRSLPVTLPIAELVTQLNRFQPDVLAGYPSVLTLLAEEQLAGRLRIAPGIVSTNSELRTAEMTARLREAFGTTPFDMYATTEALWGCDCDRHDGIHLFEDMTIVENVDADGDPVPDGEPGARLLVTSLVNRTQPLIRLEIGDSVTLEPEQCGCGRTLRRIRAIDGRADDVLELPGVEGAPVHVHPLQFASVARDREVVEFQVVQEGERLRVLVVPRGEAPELEPRLERTLAGKLGELGVSHPQIEVERRERLERQPGGKLQIVRADRAARQPQAA